MKLQYAGFDFVEPTPDLSDVLDRYRDRTAPPLYSYPGWGSQGLAHLPIPPKPKSRPLRYNVLEWPVGASRWSTFRGIVGSTSLAGILAATAGTTAPTDAAFTVTNDTGTVLFTARLYAIDIRPLYTGTTGRELWDVTLVCQRYFWWKVAADYPTTDVTTWANLLTALTLDAHGASPSVGTVPAAYGAPWKSRWWVPGVPLPLLMDAAAKQVGLRCVYLPDDSVKFRTYTTARTADDSRWTTWSGSVVQGGRHTDGADVAGNTPANYAVAFPGDKQTLTTGTLASLALSQYTGVTGVADAYAWIRADLNANTAGATRTAYATQAATDYYQWALSPTDATFRGVVGGDLISGLEDRVEVEYLPEKYTTVGRPAFGCTLPGPVVPPAYRVAGDRILTRVVPTDRSDRALWGDRPPAGYSYAVELKGTADGSGNWKADILVTSGSGLATGPQLGYGGDEYVLEVSSDLATPAAGDIGVAVPDPFQAYRWSFIPSGGPSNGPVTNCLSNFVGWADDTCLTLMVLQGADPGACSNINEVTLGAIGGGGEWISNTTFPVAGGDALIVISTSGGLPAASLVIWTGTSFETVAGVYIGCSGLAALEFAFPPDPLLCDDLPVECGDNILRIRAFCSECVDPIYAATCDCAECPDGAPGAYTFTLTGGTDDFVYANRAWAVYIDGCEWVSEDLAGWRATLTRVGTTLTLRVEFLADPAGLFLEYVLDPLDADCCADAEPTLSSSAGTGTTPGTPTITPVGGAQGVCGPCPSVDVPCCTPVLLLEQYNLTFGGSLSGLGTTVITWNGTNYVSPTDFGDWCGNAANKVTATVSPSACWTLSYTVTGPPVLATGDTEAETSCDPLAIAFAGTGSCGAWTAVVSEIP